jgi:hypothetical protein
MSAVGSYLAGYFIAWGARRTIKLTSIIAGAARGKRKKNEPEARDLRSLI